jgi:hypothetical protein
MTWIKTAAISLLLLTGAAFGCATLPMPTFPAPIPITVLDVLQARSAGFSWGRALHGAAMRRLDSFASAAVGASTWRNNEFVGYFTYSTPLGGANAVLIHKPCGMTAEDLARSTSFAGLGALGLGFCELPTGPQVGVVGFDPVYVQAQTCTPGGGCISQSVLVGYEPIYGPMAPIDASIGNC